MTQPNLLELAKQGNAEAITFLLNRQLQSKNITAKVVFQGECLQVMLESSQLPEQESLVAFIRKGFLNLGANSIKTVKVYGRVTGDDFPAWSQDLEIINIADRTQLETNISQLHTNTSSTSKSSKIKDIGQKVVPGVQFSKPPRPSTYLVPSILVSLLAFLPVGIAAIIFSSQVEGKYNQGDYDGAKSSSNTAKILCIVGAGIALPFYLLIISAFGFVIFTPSLTGQVSKAKQSEARNYIGTIIRSQQAYYLEYNKFASTISDLQVGIRPETENYRYEVDIDDTKAITTATAKTSKIKSYVGAVFLISSEELGQDIKLTATKVCESNQPSIIPPAIPELIGKEIICVPGSSDPYELPK